MANISDIEALVTNWANRMVEIEYSPDYKNYAKKSGALIDDIKIYARANNRDSSTLCELVWQKAKARLNPDLVEV